MQVINIKYIITDEKYSYKYAFDTETGAYIRTGILNENGADTGKDPFMGSFPHLIDVGIMGHCIHGKTGLCVKAGIGCYQSGLTVEKPNMRYEDFCEIVRQSKGRVNQFALGGRGDPDQHERIADILALCRENDIVPNFTTSGYGMTPEIAALCKKYCGAVAVSWYRSEYTLRAIDMLLTAGVKTNIHYVLGNNSIEEAIDRLQNDGFPKGINAVIFLLHKPAGLGKRDNMLSPADPRIQAFFGLIDDGAFSHKVGLDSCCVPGLVNFAKNIAMEAIDTCEGARFSCYISADMKLLPCSFDQNEKYAVSLRDNTIEQAWNSKSFEAFRQPLRTNCPECKQREACMGGCPLMPEVVLCSRREKSFKLTNYMEA